jgi:uncharacterized phage protein (TIGR02220 family)
MIQKDVWKQLIPKPKHLSVLIMFLAHEGEVLSLSRISSVHGHSKQYSHKLISELSKILLDNKVQFIIETNKNGYIFSFEKQVKKAIKKEETTTTDKNSVKAIIDYLNYKADKKFASDTKATIEVINARIKEGYTFHDFAYVINIKCQKWLNTSMEDYLRPQTLFGTKFNSYLNEKPQSQPISQIESAINEAGRTIDWGLD